MTDQEILDLIRKYTNGAASEQETALLESWYISRVREHADIAYPEDLEEKMNRRLPDILATPQFAPARRRKVWPYIAAAASIALALSLGSYYYFSGKPAEQPAADQTAHIQPGHNGATLTLANGEKILLSTAVNGQIATQPGVVITKTADGELTYAFKDHSGAGSVINTISTSKGETFRLRLPDGSSVWLNAASSLTYAANLGKEGKRSVKLSGEAYFEIEEDEAHPFIVTTARETVEVLGTHFNVNSYSDETHSKTTLAQGSVRLNGKTVLKPGEQAVVSSSGNITVREVQADEVIAWKNGKFVFEYEDIESVMRKLARWYNVEVRYEGGISDKTFSGTISRSENISAILSKITYTNNVHFKIEGRRITVMP